jgi:hypothetical protein
VEVVWAGIETLDRGLRHELLRELARLFADSVADPRSVDKVRAAVVVLREAADILGWSPSVNAYRHLRLE